MVYESTPDFILTMADNMQTTFTMSKGGKWPKRQKITITLKFKTEQKPASEATEKDLLK